MWWKEFVLTAAYTGYFPLASGTAGTLFAMALYILEYLLFGRLSWAANLVIVLVTIIPSIRLADDGERLFGIKDPSEVVLDEVMGYNISVLFYPFNWKIAICAFFIFRVIDIIKPYPAKRLERLNGGLGIMIDDCIAGIYTNVCILIMVVVSHFCGAPIY